MHLFQSAFALDFGLEAILKSIVVIGAGLTATWFMRRSSASMRHLCLSAVAAALLVLPLAMAVLPSWSVATMPSPFGHLAERASDAAGAPSAGIDATDQASPATRGAALSREPVENAAPERSSGAGWFSWVLVAWGVGTAALLIRLVGGKIYGYRIAGRAPLIDNERIVAAVARVSRELALGRNVPVVESDHLKVPFICGIARPRLVMPPHAEAWPDERLDAVIRHELAHVKRHDLFTQLLAQVACCLYWINPLAWVMERWLFIERERSCDDMAIARDIKASTYAGYLMEIMEEVGSSRSRTWVMSAMAEGTDFKDRIISVLDPVAKRAAPRLSHTAAVAAISIAIALPLSVLHPWREGAAMVPATAPVFVEMGTSANHDESGITVHEIMSSIREGLRRSADDYVFAVVTGAGTVHCETRKGQKICWHPVKIEHLIAGNRASGEPFRAGATFLELGGYQDGQNTEGRRHLSFAVPSAGDTALYGAVLGMQATDEDISKAERAWAMVAGEREAENGAALPDGVAADGLKKAELEDSASPRTRDTNADVLIALLRHSDPSFREHAATALGKSLNAGAVSALVGALRDESVSVREHAASALGKIGDERAVPPLVRVLDADRAPRVREHAASAIGLIGGVDEGYRMLVDAYWNDRDVRVRAHAATGLGYFGDLRAFDLLVEGLGSRRSEIREHCAEALGYLGDARAVEHLLQASKDRDDTVRAAAARALEMLGAKR